LSSQFAQFHAQCHSQRQQSDDDNGQCNDDSEKHSIDGRIRPNQR